MKRSVWCWLVLGVFLLSGCGFQLRGEAQLPFASAYVQAADDSTLGRELRRALAEQGKLAARAEDAPVHIQVVAEAHDKKILSLSGGGKVREYRLLYKALLKVTDGQENELIAPIDLEQVRESSYDDALILAKDAEEMAQRRAMEQEALRQALRRLSYVKR